MPMVRRVSVRPPPGKPMQEGEKEEDLGVPEPAELGSASVGRQRSRPQRSATVAEVGKKKTLSEAAMDEMVDQDLEKSSVPVVVTNNEFVDAFDLNHDGIVDKDEYASRARSSACPCLLFVPPWPVVLTAP